MINMSRTTVLYHAKEGRLKLVKAGNGRMSVT